MLHFVGQVNESRRPAKRQQQRQKHKQNPHNKNSVFTIIFIALWVLLHDVKNTLLSDIFHGRRKVPLIITDERITNPKHSGLSDSPLSHSDVR